MQQFESSVRQYLTLDPYEHFPLMTLDDDWVVIATHIEEPQVQVKAILIRGTAQLPDYA